MNAYILMNLLLDSPKLAERVERIELRESGDELKEWLHAKNFRGHSVCGKFQSGKYIAVSGTQVAYFKGAEPDFCVIEAGRTYMFFRMD